ncbi:MAG: molybdopterin molybdotransferase MoeA, partial [Acidimicrobiia bacterium]|nr:molybdopterin molybdotransferase MoeA [Acidimicrobiia bacterium]
MRPLEEVQAEVFDTVGILGTEPVTLDSAAGRVLGQDIVADEDVPPFANSAMDGFAVRSEDVIEAGAVLRLVDDVPAGRVASVALGEGEAIKIMTGAPMPDGADSILRVEDSEEEDGKVRATVAVEPGTSVRPAGGDVAAGEVVFGRGTRLTPAHVGVLATLGEALPTVYRRPTVALMSTGDELQPPDTKPLRPGMIRDSNRPMLNAMLSEIAEVVDLGRVPDDAEVMRSVLGRAAVEADAIVSSGGVSMGEHDVTKIVLLGETGVQFMQVAIKPAKPFGFGLLGGKPFFGLPGNPVSAMISFEQFVRPAL